MSTPPFEGPSSMPTMQSTLPSKVGNLVGSMHRMEISIGMWDSNEDLSCEGF